MKKILIAIDDGPTAEKVVKNGKRLAKQLKAEIALVSVADTEFLMTDGFMTPKEMEEVIRNDFIKKQSMLTDKFFKDKKVWTFVESGKPYEKILKIADEWDADIIVLGTHGRTGLSHLIMGSVAEKVTTHATKPLFIIPTK